MGIFKKAERRAEQVITAAAAEAFTAILNGSATISKANALEIPTVQACINLIADKISMLPIKLYEEINGEVNEITDDSRLKLLNYDTGDTLTGTQLKKLWVQDYFLGKGSYTYIQKNAYSMPVGLYYVDESVVSAVANTDPIFKSYALYVNGKRYVPSDFLKILRKSKGDGRGKSILDENKTIMLIAYNTMLFENGLVKKGGNKKGYIESEYEMTQKAIDAMKAALSKLYSASADYSDNIVVLNKGAKFHESSATSVEMQLNENKQTNSAELCKLFCMPPEMLTGGASEQAKVQMVSNCLMPLINLIESALDSDLLLESEKGKKYFAFDVRELTRGSIQQRYAAYEVALRNNFMQLDEVREQEDLPPLGFNYLKLGLQDVLLNPATNQIYTPNTNAMTDLNSAAAELGNKCIDKQDRNDIIEERANPYHAKDGKFTFGKVRMSKSERTRVSHQFATDFPNAERGKAYPYENRNHFYLVGVNGFGDYSFDLKVLIKGHEEAINTIKRRVEQWKD